MTKIWTDIDMLTATDLNRIEDSIAQPTPVRDTSLVIAASDAPADWKAIADYVVSGTDDVYIIRSVLMYNDDITVKLSPGTFNLGSYNTYQGIMFQSYSELVGSGRGITKLVIPTSGTYSSTQSIIYSDSTYSLKVRHLTIDLADKDTCAISISGADSVVDDVEIINCVSSSGGAQGLINVTNTASYTTIRNVRFNKVPNAGTANTATAVAGIKTQGTRTHIHNCFIDNTAAGLGGNGVTAYGRTLITHCSFIGLNRGTYFRSGSNHSLISNNSFNNCATGVFCDNFENNIMITNNSFISGRDYQLNLLGTDVYATSNIFRSDSTTALYCYSVGTGSGGCKISYNDFKNGYRTAPGNGTAPVDTSPNNRLS